MSDETLTELCKRLEHFETPRWAVEAVLNVEAVTRIVVDPCCGAGVLSEAVRDRRREARSYDLHDVRSYDIHDWGYKGQFTKRDFLDPCWHLVQETTVLMNPPFKKSQAFIEKAHGLNARKILCFCPFQFWTGKRRRTFWDRFPPARIHVLAERATCWRHDIPQEERKNDTPTVYAWFVFERGQGTKTPPVGRLYKADAD